MRLQRVQVRKNKEGKNFHKWQITLPPAFIQELGWDAGDDLEATIKDGTLVISPT